MATIYYDADADLDEIAGKRIAVIGYGSQGHAHALNLKDSGGDVIVGLREGSSSRVRAEAEDLLVLTTGEAAHSADIVMILVPDQNAAETYQNEIAPNLEPGNMLMFAHGFNIHYGQVVPPDDVDVAMVAPKGPGHIIRDQFEEGVGVPALFAIQQDASGRARQITLAYAKALGATRAGLMETTFKDETETDLFGEQAVLCGGVSSLIKAGFETLVEAGYAPELAYFECLHELKLIVDLIYQGGLAYMRYSVSDTAEYGDYTGGPRVIGPESRQAMKQLLADVQSGSFARDWILENQAGKPAFNAMRNMDSEHPIEEVGERLRSMMPHIQKPRQ